MKFKIGDKVSLDLVGDPKGRIITAYDGASLLGDPAWTLPVQQSFMIFGETSYAVMDSYGNSWVAQESLVRYDNFLTRLFRAQQIDSWETPVPVSPWP